MPRTKKFCEEDVLQKAIQLFWDKGYHATSMRDLVDNLGINRASLYDTYGGKRELFEKALSKYQSNGEKWVEDVLTDQDSTKEAIVNLFTLLLKDNCTDDAMSNGCFMVNSTTEFLPGDNVINNAFNTNKQRFIQLFSACLDKGIENGEISTDKDVNATAQSLFILLCGLKVVSKTTCDKQELQNTVEKAIYTFLE